MSDEIIDQLFQQALKLSGSDREAFLNQLTAEAREKIERLLAADASAENHGLYEPIANGSNGELDPHFAATNIGGVPENLQTTHIPTADNQPMPDRIGNYKILQQIGEGGMGSVYMAEQTEPVKRRVALKVIKAGMGSKEIIARFEAERQALAMMDHQNIAKVLDAGLADDGRPFFAMELVKGVPLNQYCDKNKLTPNERLELFVQTCRAVQHAHQKGIIHRDLKPSNMLVTLYDGKPVVKVIDFGLAKALQDQMQLTARTLFTQYGQVVGTLEYMSPEQAEMNALDVDTRTDVYSLGVILYELLTGSTPIGKDRLKTEALDGILRLIKEEDAPRPSIRLSASGDAITGISDQRRTDPKKLSVILKGDLDWIAVKALEKDRSRRYDGAAALADDVERYLNDEAIDARPPTLGYRLRKLYRRHTRAMLVVLGMTTLLVFGLVGTGTMWFRAEDARAKALAAATKAHTAKREADNASTRERDARADAERERDKAEGVAARSDFRLAMARWDKGEVERAKSLLHGISREHRGVEWRLAQRMFHGSYMTLHKDAALSFHAAIAVSGDGKILCQAAKDGVRIWDAISGLQTGQIEVELSDEPQLAAHDCTLFVASDSNVQIYDLPTLQLLRTWDLGEPVTGIAVTADGQSVALAHTECAGLYDVRSGRILRRIPFEEYDGPFAFLRFSRNDSVLIAGAQCFADLDVADSKFKQVPYGMLAPFPTQVGVFEERGLHLLGADTPSIWENENGIEIPAPTIPVRWEKVGSPPVLSSCGTMLASSTGTEIVIVDVIANSSRTLRGHSNEVRALAFHPNSRVLYSAAAEGTIKAWDLRKSANREVYLGGLHDVECDITPDGSSIVSIADSRLMVTDPATGVHMRTLHYHGSLSVVGCGLGGVVATGSHSDRLQIWNLPKGELLHDVRTQSGTIEAIEFSPRGRQFAVSHEGGTISMWDASTATCLRELSFGDYVHAIRFHPTKSVLAIGGNHDYVVLWDFDSGQTQRVLTAGRNSIFDIAFSPDGESIVYSQGPTLNLWDLRRGKLAAQQGMNSSVSGLAFLSPVRLVACEKSQVSILDVATMEPLLSLTTKGLDDWGNETAVAGGSLFVKQEDDVVTVVHLPSSRPYVISISARAAISRDGQFMIVPVGGRLVEVLSQKDGRLLATLKCDTEVVSASLSDDSKVVAVQTTAGQVELWDMDSTSRLDAIALDGRTLIGFQEDNSLVSYDEKKAMRGIGVPAFVWDRDQRVWKEGAFPEYEPVESKYWDYRDCAGRDELFDRRLGLDEGEREFRRSIANVDRHWHSTRAAQCEVNRNWVAACYHYATILQGSFRLPTFYRFQDAYEKTDSRWRARLPKIVRDVASFDPTTKTDVSTVAELGERNFVSNPQRIHDVLSQTAAKCDDPFVSAAIELKLLNYIEENRTEITRSREPELTQKYPEGDARRIWIELERQQTDWSALSRIWAWGFQTTEFSFDTDREKLRVAVGLSDDLDFQSRFNWNYAATPFKQLSQMRTREGWELVEEVSCETENGDRLTGLWHRTADKSERFAEASSAFQDLKYSDEDVSPTKGTLDQLETWFKEFPTAKFAGTLGEGYVRIGDLAQARRKLEFALKHWNSKGISERVGLLDLLIQVELKLGDRGAAANRRDEFQRWLKENPKYRMYYEAELERFNGYLEEVDDE